MTPRLTDRDPHDALATSLLVRDWIYADESRWNEADIALTEGLIEQGVLAPTDMIEWIEASLDEGTPIGVDLLILDPEEDDTVLTIGLDGSVRQRVL